MWNDEKIAELCQLWTGGVSASDIAREIGAVSRNAVIGKAHRLGLCPRAALGKPRRARPAKATPAPRKPPVAVVLPKPPPVAPVAPVINYVPIARVSFDQLESHHCRYPVGDPRSADFGFCGQTRVEGRPYCPSCNAVANVPLAPRTRIPLVVWKHRFGSMVKAIEI